MGAPRSPRGDISGARKLGASEPLIYNFCSKETGAYYEDVHFGSYPGCTPITVGMVSRLRVDDPMQTATQSFADLEPAPVPSASAEQYARRRNIARADNGFGMLRAQEGTVLMGHYRSSLASSAA